MMRALRHITKLSDDGGAFLVDVRCKCGYGRWIKPEQLARWFGRDATLASIALRMRCSKCGAKAAQVVAVAAPRPRGIPKNPH